MIVGCGQPVTRDRMKVRSWPRGAAGGRCRRPLTRRDPLLPVGIPKTRRVKLQEADVRRTTKLGRLARGGSSALAGAPCGKEIAARRWDPGAVAQQ